MKFNHVAEFIECLGDAIIIIDDSSTIKYANRVCTELFGYAEQAMIGLNVEQLMSEVPANHGQHVKAFVQEDSKARPMLARGFMPCIRQDGQLFNAKISIASVSLDDQIFGMATIQDFSSIYSELKQLEWHANQDMLTGLYNRRYLEKIIEPDSRLMQSWKNIGVMYLDLNGFKPVNDTYGHDVGDTVLKVISNRLKTSVRFDDLVFRVGGDEFLVFMNMTYVENRKNGLMHIAENILQQTSKPIKSKVFSLNVGISAGCGLYPEDSEDIHELIKMCDKVMYAAKKLENTTQLLSVG